MTTRHPTPTTRAARSRNRPLRRDGPRPARPRRGRRARPGGRLPGRSCRAVVASHWGPNGVDGTQTLVAYTVTATAFVVGLSLLLALVAWVMPGDGRRIMATTVGVMSGFLGTVLYGALLGQRGVTDPSAAMLSPMVFVLGALVGAVLGAVAWMLNPVLPRPDPVTPAMPGGCSTHTSRRG